LLVWKRFIDDISLWDTTRQRRDYTIGLTNTIKLSSLPLKYPKQKQTSWTLLFTKRKDLKASRCTHFSTGHISIWSKKRLHQRRGCTKKLLRTSSSKTLFEESITNFKTHLLERGYPENFSALLKTEKKPSDRNKNKTRKII